MRAAACAQLTSSRQSSTVAQLLRVAIELDHDKVWNMQDKAEFYSEVLTVVVDGKEEKVKVQAVQRHAFKPKLTHIDFVRA